MSSDLRPARISPGQVPEQVAEGIRQLAEAEPTVRLDEEVDLVGGPGIGSGAQWYLVTVDSGQVQARRESS